MPARPISHNPWPRARPAITASSWVSIYRDQTGKDPAASWPSSGECFPMCRTTERRLTAFAEGMTLVELLIASSMLLMLAGVWAAWPRPWRPAPTTARGMPMPRSMPAWRLERITREIGGPPPSGTTRASPWCTRTSPARVPGYAARLASGRRQPVNAAGPPLVSELVIYCPNPQQPEQLLEIRAPNDARTIPLDESSESKPLAGDGGGDQDGCSKPARGDHQTCCAWPRSSSGNLPSSRRGGGAVRSGAAPLGERVERLSQRHARLDGSALAAGHVQLADRHAAIVAADRAATAPRPATAEDTTGQAAIPFLGSAALYYNVVP